MSTAPGPYSSARRYWADARDPRPPARRRAGDRRAVRPDRRRQDGDRRGARPAAPRPRRASGRGVRRRAAGLQRPGDPHRRGLGERAGFAGAPVGVVPPGGCDVQRGRVRTAGARGDRPARGGRGAGRPPGAGRGGASRGPGGALTRGRPPRRGLGEQWQAETDRRGAPAVHALLAVRAPWAAAGIDPNDRRRVVRALELLDAGELEPAPGPSQLWSAELRRATALAGLTMARGARYPPIGERVGGRRGAGGREAGRRGPP